MNRLKSSKACSCTLKFILLVGACVLFAFIWSILIYVTLDFAELHTRSKGGKPHLFAYLSTVAEYHSKIPGLDYPSPVITEVASMGTTYYPLQELLASWNPNDVDPHKWEKSKAHPSYGFGLPRFDYQNPDHVNAATKYRINEQPFVYYNIPELTAATEQHFSFQNLLANMENQPFRVEVSETNKYMYFQVRDSEKTRAWFPDWKAPQFNSKMSFAEFLEAAEEAENRPTVLVNSSLPYLTINAHAGFKTEWIRKALPFFDHKKSDFVVDPSDLRGINCRFGVKGIAAAAHYDSGRNFIAMVRGRKRYILLPPSECKNLALLPKRHPSARHSSVDWSDPSQFAAYPNLFNSSATEYVLSQGEMLYIPAFWFHYIVSQDSSIQCNCRSGGGGDEKIFAIIDECGKSTSSGGTANRQHLRRGNQNKLSG